MTQAPLKKRLGQYFSGEKVAELLVDMCSLSGGESVIDPMAGNGDMLAAAISAGVTAENVYGIEIDPEAGHKCEASFELGSVYVGDAFSAEPYISFGRTSWDLVITNPPYVRYQSMKNYEGSGVVLKNATEIRNSLSRIVNSVKGLQEKEKACLQRIIKSYSGLSDMAVPAWILCAALTMQGGTLAMVVPESWISRDYALTIKYMLLKFFDVQYIVEDLNSAWFPDVLVKTNLLVAKRIPFRDNLITAQDLTYKQVKLSATLIGECSLIDGLVFQGHTGRDGFMKLLHDDVDASGDGFDMKHISMGDLISELTASHLLDKLEPGSLDIAKATIPKVLIDIVGSVPSAVVDISAWGFEVGQGLRTGANRFFYTTLSRHDCGYDCVETNDIFGNCVIPVPQKYSLPSLRYQNDIKGSFVADVSLLPHRLLYIQEVIPYGSALAAHIAEAKTLPIENTGIITTFPELSAVKSNIRQDRDWYMLPALMNRHLPQLSISRVNYKNTRCIKIADGVVVDANFSTLWSKSKQEAFAMFGLLNSSWVQAYFESIATVMGGGALKVEATHIRRLLIPFPNEALVDKLSRLGKHLADTGADDILREIDRTVLRALLNASDVSRQESALREYVQLKGNARQRKI